MGAVLIAGDEIEVRIGCYTASQAGINTCYFTCQGAGGPGITTDFAAAMFDGIFAPLYKAAMAAGATYYGVSVARVSPLPRTAASVSSANPGPGTYGPDLLPQQVAGIVSSVTDYGGVKYRGRVYVPFPEETASDSATNKPTLLYVAALDAIGDAIYVPYVLADGADTLNLTPVVFHRDGSPPTTIVGNRARQRWGTQRRRSSSGQTNGAPPF